MFIIHVRTKRCIPCATDPLITIAVKLERKLKISHGCFAFYKKTSVAEFAYFSKVTYLPYITSRPITWS